MNDYVCLRSPCGRSEPLLSKSQSFLVSEHIGWHHFFLGPHMPHRLGSSVLLGCLWSPRSPAAGRGRGLVAAPGQGPLGSRRSIQLLLLGQVNGCLCHASDPLAVWQLRTLPQISLIIFPFILLLSSYSYFRLSLIGVKKSIFSLSSSEVMNPFEVMGAYCPLLGTGGRLLSYSATRCWVWGKGSSAKSWEAKDALRFWAKSLDSGCVWCFGWETGVTQH